ncbi:MAG: hypothetical protein EB089_07310, partial [Acidimicrobiia bacterium]|nr:hypothetical protein [Acidimicrobiia bacterium]
MAFTLPSDWATYDPSEKINWFNQNQVDENALRGVGVDQGSIDWMKSQGYQGFYESADDRQQDAIDAVTVRPAETFQGGLSSISQPTNFDYSYDYTPQSNYTAPIDYGSQSSYVAPVDTSSAYDYATSTGGIGVNQMDQNIRDFFANNPSESATRAAMSEYGVSEADIQRATGRTLQEIYAPAVAGALSSVTADTLSGAVGNDTVSGALASVDISNQAYYASDGTKFGSQVERDNYERSIAPKTAYDYATGAGGIGLEAMNQNIRNFFAGNPTENLGVATTTGASGTDTVTGGLGASTLTGATGNDSVTGGSDLILTDYQGNQYNAKQLQNLAGQIVGNFDLKSTGGVYGVDAGQSIGFDYNEIQKLFAEGKSPTVGDQVVLDIARGLLSEGITDLKQLEGAKLLGTYGRGL